jgi:ABC-type lipoprotein release transport system permease subunit
LYGVGHYDPLTLISVPVMLTIVAAGASFLPARRVTRIDPSQTLRME